jgi:hypothetical protein
VYFCFNSSSASSVSCTFCNCNIYVTFVLHLY